MTSLQYNPEIISLMISIGNLAKHLISLWLVVNCAQVLFIGQDLSSVTSSTLSGFKTVLLELHV